MNEPAPLAVGDFVPLHYDGKRATAQVVKVWEPGLYNLRVYRDASESTRETERWFSWAHRIACHMVPETASRP